MAVKLLTPFGGHQLLLLGKITAEFPLLDALLNMTLAHLTGKGIEIGEFIPEGFARKIKSIKKSLKDDFPNKPYTAELLDILRILKDINQRRVDVTHGLAMSKEPTPDAKLEWVRSRKGGKHPTITTEFLQTLLDDMYIVNSQLAGLLTDHGLLTLEPLDKSS